MGNNLDTLFLDRFVDALSRMCRATPPRDACAAWIDTDSDELQCWVGLHADLPDWSQCIVLIDAAIVWASTPVEGRAYGQHGNYVHATIESLRAQLAEVTDELEIMRHQRDQAQDERDEARAEVERLNESTMTISWTERATEEACGVSVGLDPLSDVTWTSFYVGVEIRAFFVCLSQWERRVALAEVERLTRERDLQPTITAEDAARCAWNVCGDEPEDGDAAERIDAALRAHAVRAKVPRG